MQFYLHTRGPVISSIFQATHKAISCVTHGYQVNMDGSGVKRLVPPMRCMYPAPFTNPKNEVSFFFEF